VFVYLRRHLASEGIVPIGVTLSRCLCVCVCVCVYADFRGGSLGRASFDSGVIDKGNSDTQSAVCFSVIPKYITLNDLDWLFRVKFCFRAGLAGSDRATFEK